FGRADYAWPAAPLTEPDNKAAGQWLLLASDQQPLAWVRLNDSLRRNAASIVSGLQQRGIAVSLLTGDPGASGQVVADALGITDLQTGVSPEQKLAAVRAWQQAGE